MKKFLGWASVLLLFVSCGSSEHRTADVADPLLQEFENRKQAYLDYCLDPDPDHGGEGLYTQIVRMERMQGPLDEKEFIDAFDHIDARLDTSDFRMAALIRILYQYRDSPLLSDELLARMEDVVREFKYWIDEEKPGEDKPEPDKMVYWSENHQILFHSAEYLAGQLYPEVPLGDSGMTGRKHMEKAGVLIRKWLDFRSRIGFSEWHSNVYYEEDLGALFNLVDFAEDPDLAERAAMAADLLLFDIGLHTQFGTFGSSHGRSYQKDKLSGSLDDTACVSRIVWGQGVFNSRSSRAAVSLAVSPKYRMPTALLYVGRDRGTPWVDRERMGIDPEDAEDYGLTFEDFSSGMFWWGMGAYAPWQVIDLSFEMADAYNLWESDFWAPFRFLRCLLPLGVLPDASKALSPFTEGSILGRVNTYTYRTSDYMLSCAQDYRPGYVSFQQHIWQATLGLDAVVFTTHPGTLPESIEMIGHWTGGASMPRAAQFKNVLVAIYKPLVRNLFPDITHAYFPKVYFDEVVQEGAWVFGRKGDGYVALYSHQQPFQWVTEGEWADKELVAPGMDNVWICEMGSYKESGSFDDFRAAILQAPVSVDAYSVKYDSPSRGQIRFGWEEPFLVQGVPVALVGYPRYDNPYCSTEFGQTVYHIRGGGRQLLLDFDRGDRSLAR